MAKLQRSGQSARIAFDAFGRRFDLELESNDRLLRRLPAGRRAELPPHDVYRGRLAGLPGSWVRLTRLPDGLYGAIWDGNELYSIVPAHAAAPFMGGATPANSDQTLIYRASDVDVLVGAGFCTVLDARGGTSKPMTAGDQFKALLQELPRRASTAAADATLELEVAMIGDFEFYSAETDPTGALLNRVNIVDGIFSEQVGVTIAATELKVFDGPADPFTTSVPGVLLDEVGRYRVATPAIAATGLAHLVTGRDLNGSTVGIAYIAGVCEAEIGVSLSERFFDPFVSALIAAHEFGHNFGAPHDTETGSPCRTTPTGFLMEPNINGSDRFSQCSLDQMAPVIAASSCIRQRGYVDVGLELTQTRYDTHTRVPVRVAFDVVNYGTAAAEEAAVSIALASDLTATPVSVNGGSCTSGPGNITCQMERIPPGERRQIEIEAIALQAGLHVSSIATSATDDIDSDNNGAAFELNAAAAIVASLQVEPPAFIETLSGDTFEIAYLVRVTGVQPFEEASVDTVAAGFTVASAIAPGGTCIISGSIVSCSLGDIPPGSTRRVVLRLSGGAAGNRQVRHTLRGAIDDTNDDNFAAHSVRVNPLVDLVMKAEPGPALVRNGESFVRSFTVLSLGPREAREATVDVSRSAELEISGVVAQGAGCQLQSGFTSYLCRFSAPIEAGGTRRIDVTLRGIRAGHGRLNSNVFSPDNQHFAGPLSTRAEAVVEIREAADVRIDGQPSMHGYDFKPIHVTQLVSSIGFARAEAARLTLNLPTGVTAVSALASAGACTIVASSVRCEMGSLEPDTTAEVELELLADRIGAFSLEMEANAGNDADPDNNSRTFSLTVAPNIDVSLDPLPDDLQVKVGRTIRYPITVRSASQPVNNVEVRFQSSSSTNFHIQDATSTQGTCAFTDDSMTCALGTLPANSAVLMELDIVGHIPLVTGISVSARGDMDVDRENEDQNEVVVVIEPGNVAASMAAPTIRVAAGASFDHPRVFALVTAETQAVTLRVVVPAALTIEAVTPESGQCDVNADTVECAFGDLATSEQRFVDLRLRANQAGSFTTQLEVMAAEDAISEDNMASVTIDVDAAPPPPSSGGGGGSLDWLSLMLGALGLGVRRRRRFANST